MSTLGVSIALPGATVALGSSSSASSTSSSSTPTAVTTGTTKAAWAMKPGETLLYNSRGYLGPFNWSQWVVAFVWPDGEAVLVGPGKQVMRTEGLSVVKNLRRASEVYPDDPSPMAVNP